MSTYTRPSLTPRTFLDAAGEVIPYGSRWPGGQPPDDAYSVVSHPERFADLHLIADALVEYLSRTYRVSLHDDASFAEDLLHPPPEVIRVVRLVPHDADAAPLTFVYTSFPGIVIHAGVLQDFAFPDCGCDACDETVEACADEMEETALSVAEGRFSERVIANSPLSVRYDIEWMNGMHRRSGSKAADGIPATRLAAAAERLATLQTGWHAWSRRGT